VLVFLLQARTTLSIEAREAKQKQPREFTSCAIFSESSRAFREEFREQAPSKKVEFGLGRPGSENTSPQYQNTSKPNLIKQ
jgi:hypothetical protein